VNKNKLRALSSNIVLIIASVFFAILTVEVYLRWQGYNPMKWTGEGRDLILRPSSSDGRLYEATPNATGFVWNTEISINSAGFRGPNLSTDKAAGVKRIIVLGDSVAFGNNLAIEDTISSQLEQLFVVGNQRVEVLNLALGGYDTHQEVSTLEHLGLPFQPDAVVLAYCFNDIGVDSVNLAYIKKAQRYRSSLIYKSRVAQFIQVSIDRIMAGRNSANFSEEFAEKNKSQILDVSDDQILEILVETLKANLSSGSDYHRFAVLYTSPAHLGKLRFSLERLRGLQEEGDFDVYAVIIPVLDENFQNRKVYDSIYHILSHEFRRAGFQTVNMHRDFAEVGIQSFMDGGFDAIHPNRVGHKLMAERLVREMQN
jgi:lysophospholipase L1-like esterase